MYRHTYIEVNLDCLKNNVRSIIKHYPKYDYYIGVVKGNVYGHGSYAVGALIQGGVNYLAVSSLEEAIDIRNENKQIPILCLEPISLEYLEECIKQNITLTIPSKAYLEELLACSINNSLKLHLKIDSGMNRLGVKDKQEVEEMVALIGKNVFLELEGIYTHFITPGISDSIWDKQVETFLDLTSSIDLSKIKMVHLGRSLTLVNHPKLEFCNGIRLGLIMYGFDNTPHYGNGILDRLRKIKADMRIKKQHISETSLVCKAKLEQGFSLYSEVMEIKKVMPGEYIGYGTGYQVKEEMTIGIVPIGYADGFSRKNRGRDVVIGGTRYPILGEVGMGMIQVQVGDKTKRYTAVELLGKNIPIREVSLHNHTTSYETMCALKTELPRIYTEGGKIVHITEKR